MRIDAYIHFVHDSSKLDEILTIVKQVYYKEVAIMALGQDILDAVAAETTAVDSFIALVQGLVANNTISSAVAAEIISAVNSNKAKLDAAILANTTPPTP